jgi:hypothetical protein
MKNVPILAGKNKINNFNQMLGDNSGESISDKNRLYCELTGIYWV